MDASQHKRIQDDGESVLNNLVGHNHERERRKRKEAAAKRRDKEDRRERHRQEDEQRRIKEEKARLFEKLNKPKPKPASSKKP